LEQNFATLSEAPWLTLVLLFRKYPAVLFEINQEIGRPFGPLPQYGGQAKARWPTKAVNVLYPKRKLITWPVIAARTLNLAESA
jgi:hypothetical protein